MSMAVPYTTNIKKNVRTISVTNAWMTVASLPTAGVPRPDGCKGIDGHRELDHKCGDDSTETLSNDVTACVAETDLLRYKRTDGHGWIEMSTLMAMVALIITAMVRPCARAIPTSPDFPPSI